MFYASLANKLTECQKGGERIHNHNCTKNSVQEEQLLSTAQLLVKRIPDKFINKTCTRLNIFAGLFRWYYHMCFTNTRSIFYFFISQFSRILRCCDTPSLEHSTVSPGSLITDNSLMIVYERLLYKGCYYMGSGRLCKTLLERVCLQMIEFCFYLHLIQCSRFLFECVFILLLSYEQTVCEIVVSTAKKTYEWMRGEHFDFVDCKRQPNLKT